jgi:hypothetical protein
MNILAAHHYAKIFPPVCVGGARFGDFEVPALLVDILSATCTSIFSLLSAFKFFEFCDVQQAFQVHESHSNQICIELQWKFHH